MPTKKHVAVKATKPGLDANISLAISGETYFLNFDFNAIARLEEEHNINLLTGVDFSSPSKVRAMLWAACLKRHPDMSLEDAGSLITFESYAEVLPALLDAFNISTKPAEDKRPNV